MHMLTVIQVSKQMVTSQLPAKLSMSPFRFYNVSNTRMMLDAAAKLFVYEFLLMHFDREKLCIRSSSLD